MNEIFYFLTFFFVQVWVFRNILFWVYLWQLKEYRLDRLLIHFKETKQGRNLFFNIENLIKIIAFTVYFYTVFNSSYLFPYQVFISLVYFISFLQVTKEVFSRKLKRPTFTFKALLISLLTVSLLVSLYLFPLFDKFFWLVFLDRFTFVLIAFLVSIFSIPSDFYKDFLIYLASRKRNKFTNLISIGVTGSYGKGSTKEYLWAILSVRFNVLRTIGSQNTSVSIAKTILNNLNHEHEIFLAEMGAYKIGEIKEICFMVKPKIGIITAVGQQHSALFGGIEKIKKAKYELIESLPKNGVGLFNANNQLAFDLALASKKKHVTYFADYNNRIEEYEEKFDILAINIKENKFYISFDVSFKKKKKILKELKVKLIGKHNVENLLPGIYIALSLGMTIEEIKEGLMKILPVKKTMEPYVDQNGTVLIDDTFNANPVSILAASSYMKLFKGKKILVLQPMIELGKNGKIEHYQTAKKISQIADTLILTNNNFIEEIKKGLSESKRNCDIKVMESTKVAEFISNKLSKDDVVVFEGKEAERALSLVEYKKPFYGTLKD